jgi:hypothetical protein
VSKKISKSPERHTFQLNNAKKRAEEDGKEVPEHYLGFWKTAQEQDEANLVDPEWQRNNLEYDLRSTDWILTKARNNPTYAQNIYAALCNMQWQKLATMPILREERWSCSWRHAGGIVADMLQKGDYIDWYCSGMGGLSYDPEEGVPKGYVSEGVVTDEIRADFQQIGWVPVPWDEDSV